MNEDNLGAPTKMGFAVAAAGPKGLHFTQRLIDDGWIPSCIYSYRQKGDSTNAFSRLQSLSADHRIKFEQSRSPSNAEASRLFFVGWQFAFAGDSDHVVVFHDSLLPNHRGFAPTVSALIAGDAEIGVSAFRPDSGIDTGPVIKQASFSVEAPMKIAEALRRQTELMCDIATDILKSDIKGIPLTAHPQQNHRATYSLWRDEDDYWIDFARSAEEVLRFIRAVGHPYSGAKCLVSGTEVRVLDAEVATEDLPFVDRHVGKVWRFENKQPVVVCGLGLLRVTEMLTKDNGAVVLNSVRTRFHGRL